MINRKKIFAIISDYDGTLCPTGNMRIKDQNMVPRRLEEILQEISKEIPICILSSKDYWFLSPRVQFASIISCIMGIETLVMDKSSDVRPKIKDHRMLYENSTLIKSAKALEKLSEDVISRFPDIMVERKFTSEGFLAGVTFDWRDIKDWKGYSKLITEYVKKTLPYEPYCFPNCLYLQIYDSHPFLDVYAIKCDKGRGFDCVMTELKCIEKSGILYLGDSENDNPAFAKAGISIGIHSDPRVNPRLNCNYSLDYEQLSLFLQKLRDNDYLFCDELLAGHRM